MIDVSQRIARVDCLNVLKMLAMLIIKGALL
jgi:hypothetical protein